MLLQQQSVKLFMLLQQQSVIVFVLLQQQSVKVFILFQSLLLKYLCCYSAYSSRWLSPTTVAVPTAVGQVQIFGTPCNAEYSLP